MTERTGRFSWFGTRPNDSYRADWRRCRRCNGVASIAGFFVDEHVTENRNRRYVCWSCVEHEVPLTELLMVLVP